MIKRVILGTLFLAVMSCKDQGPPPPPTVDGAWAGASGNFTFNLTLAQSGSTVTGSGQVGGPDESLALTVSSGTFVAPNVSMVLSAQGFQPMNYSGALATNNSNQIIGRVNGSGFQNDVLVLTRFP